MNQEPVKRGRGRPRKNPIPEQQVSVSEMAATDQASSTGSESVSTPAAIKVHIYPSFRGEDKGDGGIRRVVEAQIKHLPAFGIEIVDTAEEADVIAYHATVPETYVRLYPQKTFVSMCHGLYWSEYEWGNWALKANADVMEGMRVADAITAPSEWVANNIRRHTSRPVTVIPHGVDYAFWSALSRQFEPKDYVLWNKTRPDPVCDPDALNKLAELMPRQKFISTFGANLNNLGLTGRLNYEDAQKIIAQAGVYLCTSRETFGIGTLEAMACGVPVVGFNFGGQAEFIEHGKDGWLAKPGDIEGLAEGVRTVLREREAYSMYAKQKAAGFTWEAACEKYAELFHEAYEKKNRKGPRTSIIITNYQLHELLPQCLKSVEEQTDTDWECIVVDDASPTESGREWVRIWAERDPRFKLIANRRNVYLAEARNIGIRAAQGRYILPLDADDMLDTNTVQLLADALDADRSIHVAYGNVKFINEDLTPSIYGAQFEPGHSSWPYQFLHEQQIKQRNLLPYCSMFRKEAWEYTGGYRRRCRTAEDADMWTRMSSYGFRPKMVTDKDTLIYRNRAGSMSREQGDTDWIRWFTWSRIPDITPAGAATQEQLPVASLDPVVISVIIPVGAGHEKLVTDAVDSVDAQTFKNWECIVINDTGVPLDTELPAWVKVVETYGDSGPAHARNVGIAASRGRLFLPLDADDYLEPEALYKMYEAHRIQGDVIYSDFWQTDADNVITLHECDDYDPELIIGSKRQVGEEMREGMIHAVTALTPKSAWAQIGGYDESLPAWEDWDFQISLGSIGVCSRRVSAPLFFYRKHTGYRRENNYEFFEESKEGILRKWGVLWEGGKKLMACSSCSGRRTVYPQQSMYQAPKQAPNQDAVLIQYSGGKEGAMPFRGPSKTTYWFSNGETKWVLAQDVDMFLRYGHFQIATPEVTAEREPALVADGPPN